VHPIRALVAAMEERRLRRIAKVRLERLLPREAAVKISGRRPGEGIFRRRCLGECARVPTAATVTPSSDSSRSGGRRSRRNELSSRRDVPPEARWSSRLNPRFLGNRDADCRSPRLYLRKEFEPSSGSRSRFGSQPRTKRPPPVVMITRFMTTSIRS
jgi:hypothetical protein